jgi:hypothetical protein
MDNDKWLVPADDGTSLAKLNAANEYTETFGLKLSEEDGALLLAERKNILKKQERVEFGEGILPKLIFAFCDSPYIYQDNYTDTLGRLQEIFYMYKNETLDEIPDDELIEFMKEQFDGSCQGSVDYLEDTSLEIFARKSRFGVHDSREEDDEI